MVHGKNKYYLYLLTLPVMAVSVFSLPALANKSNHNKELNADITINRQNSDETGNGLLSFYGMISEAPCHINMGSQEQLIDIGNMAVSVPGESLSREQLFPFQVSLDECSPVLSTDPSPYQGNISLLKVRFINHVVSQQQGDTRQNIDIMINDRHGNTIPFGVYRYPELRPGNTQDLQFSVSVYNAVPERAKAAYQGTIAFELDYD